jgi:hypothetical protein
MHFRSFRQALACHARPRYFYSLVKYELVKWRAWVTVSE